MTEDEIRQLTTEVGAVLTPYAKKGKIAGFRLIIGMYTGTAEICPLIIGATVSEEVRSMLEDPDFCKSADGKPPVYVYGNN